MVRNLLNRDQFPFTPVTLVPIVVIFTKFDKLVNEYKIDLMARQDSDVENHALQKAHESIEEYCAKRLKDVAGEDIRYLAVSNKSQSSDILLWSPSHFRVFFHRKILSSDSQTCGTYIRGSLQARCE